MLMPVKEGWTRSREAGEGWDKSWALQCPGPALPSGLTPSTPHLHSLAHSAEPG